MAKGQHIRVWREGIIGYWHHGIDCGGGQVIHFSGEPSEKRTASICTTTNKAFAAGGKVEVVQHKKGSVPTVVVSRAESRLGQTGYNLPFNNCEHFACWCATGKQKSQQIRRTAGAFLVTEVASLVVPLIGWPVRIGKTALSVLASRIARKGIQAGKKRKRNGRKRRR